MARHFLNKTELDEIIKKYAGYFKDINEEASKKQPDMEKLKELSKEGAKISTLADSISINPGALRESVDIECNVCRKNFEANRVAHVCGNACRLVCTRENKEAAWNKFYDNFVEYYNENKCVAKFTWAHRQLTRRKMPDEQKEKLLKITPKFFELEPVLNEEVNADNAQNTRFWLDESLRANKN